MLTLYLLRHAKSSWKDNNQSDFDRPLNERGSRDAEALGRHLQKAGIHPELALVSPAARAIETCQLLAGNLHPAPPVIRSPKLYDAKPADIMSEIHQHGQSCSDLIVIAHNPGIETLVWQLTAIDPNNSLEICALKYPTAGLATLVFDITAWDQLAPKSGTLIDYTTPRLRRSGT